MSTHTIFAFLLFALVASITPGPNNLMLLASGVNFGFRASVPHMFGISFGFVLLVIAIGFGLAEIFSTLPWSYDLLKIVGAIYMLYLAWRIATAGPLQDSADVIAAKPMTFWNAALFQWVNPKAWVMTVGAFSAYVPPASGWVGIIDAACLFVLVGLPSLTTWTLFGSGLRRVLKLRRNVLIFNYGMAALLIASLYPFLHGSVSAH